MRKINFLILFLLSTLVLHCFQDSINELDLPPLTKKAFHSLEDKSLLTSRDIEILVALEKKDTHALMGYMDETVDFVWYVDHSEMADLYEFRKSIEGKVFHGIFSRHYALLFEPEAIGDKNNQFTNFSFLDALKNLEKLEISISDKNKKEIKFFFPIGNPSQLKYGEEGENIIVQQCNILGCKITQFVIK